MVDIAGVRKDAFDYLVAVCVATEVPPHDSPIEEMKAVIDVIRNRARLGTFGGPLAVDVVMKPRQFSAVCREDYWRRALNGEWFPWHVEKALELWRQEWEDTTDGATHYYSPISMVPKWSAPSWAPSMTPVNVPGVRGDYFRFFKP